MHVCVCIVRDWCCCRTSVHYLVIVMVFFFISKLLLLTVNHYLSICVYGPFSSVIISIADTCLCSGGGIVCEGGDDEVDSERNGTEQEGTGCPGAEYSEGPG